MKRRPPNGFSRLMLPADPDERSDWLFHAAVRAYMIVVGLGAAAFSVFS